MPTDKKARNTKRNNRIDHQKGIRQEYERARRWIFATQDTCGICGRPVDFSLPPGDPGAPTIDHIIPVSKGGSPVDRENMQLAHNACNREKSNRLIPKTKDNRSAAELNRDLPLSFDWLNYRAKDDES